MSADTSSQNVSKEKALAEYLKKCSDPAYTSKVIGGGIIFKKAQSKDSWKKRTYFVKDDKKLLYFYYGGKAKPPLGMLDVTSALLSTGPADNIKKSGATKTEAISLNVSFANEPADSNNKHFVFENSSEAKKFALMLCYCSKNTNVMVFSQMMEWPDLEEACGVISGASEKRYLDVQKCKEKVQFEGELVKYEDELDELEHKQKLFFSIKAQNSKTKTTDESFEVLQANLLLPIVEQRIDYLKKKKQEMNEKYLELRSYLAGLEKAKELEKERIEREDTKIERESSPPTVPSTSSVTSSNSSVAESDHDQQQENAGSKTLRMKSFRRLMSLSRGTKRSNSVNSDENNRPESSPAKENERQNEVESTTERGIPPPPRKSTSYSITSAESDKTNQSKSELHHDGHRFSNTARNFAINQHEAPVSAQGHTESLHFDALTSQSSPINSHLPVADSNAYDIVHREPLVDDKTHSFCSECLRTMKSFVPFDIFTSDYTQDILVNKHGLTKKLSERIMKKKILWIIHLTIREIERIPDRDIISGGKYNIKGHNLDLVELAAVYAVLPGSFLQAVDPSGRKEIWRREIEDRLLCYLHGKRDDTLTTDELRHEAYTTTNMGPKWQERASLDAKLHHMLSLFQVVKIDCIEGASNESTENSFEKLTELQRELSTLMETKQFKTIVASKKSTAKMKKKMSSRREEV